MLYVSMVKVHPGRPHPWPELYRERPGKGLNPIKDRPHPTKRRDYWTFADAEPNTEEAEETGAISKRK